MLTVQPTPVPLPSTISESTLVGSIEPTPPNTPPTDSTSSATDMSSPCSCKNCGAVITVLSEADYPREAQLRIEELEQQVKEFSVRAVMAAERLAQAQKEVMELRRKSESGSSTTSSTTSPTSPSSSTSAAAAAASAAAANMKRNNTVTATLQNMSKASSAKINQFFYRSNTAPTAPASEIPPVERPPTPPESMSRASMDSQALDDLSNALCEERRHREIAEKKLNEVKNELEDLSVSLFQQANEMVSSERRARARLEERVTMLEQRDVDKRVRLEMLEKGFDRIQRVRGVLNIPGGHI
ncbi:hypothetical protein Dda_2653 [Drechslerella dactyloides]|uniref:GDP/GTP exchange factor Sec2 N-terminal domain-containing protein n=1 Tax=Drechslerella dactyloides TaxID=74499 RepID=A0AAD6IZW2_DREDA|nr:hypothetical protein Dda_2653 [Drechslerella dactyloides]